MPYDYIEEYQKQDDETIWEFRDKDAQSKISTDETTVEGNPINFSTLSAQNAKSTILSVEPIQDLHGYSKPWVGGAGKNLLPLILDDIKTLNTQEWGVTWTGNSCVLGNVTFTILTDSEDNVIGIKTNGTASERITFYLKRDLTYQDFPNQMKLNGNTNYSETAFIRIQLRDNPWTADADDLGSSADGVTFQFANNEAIHQAIIRIDSGVSVTNKIFYPMVRLASIADSNFEPYSNICPISGRTEIGILGCGKNLLPKDYELTDRNGITHSVNDDGTFILTGTTTSKPYYAYIRSINNPLPVEYGQNYVVSFLKNGTLMPNISKVHARVVKVKNGVQGSDMNANNGIISFTVDDSFDSIFIYINAEDTGIDMSGTYAIQLEVGTSNTSYEPYTKSNDLTISLGQTVYGGTLDVENGVLVVDEVNTDLGDLTWGYDSQYTRFASNDISGKKNQGYARQEKFLCSCYEVISDRRPASEVPDYSIYSANLKVFVTDSRYGTDASAFKTGVTGQTICYRLATPITINLTPNEISLLEGVNNISTDGDKITLTYRDGKVATLGDLLDLEKKLSGEEPYGFIEHMDILDPAQRIEYIGKNKNYKPVTVNLSGDHLANYNEWYDFFVLKENKPYMIKADGTVDYALDPNDYTKKFDGSASDVADTTYTGGAFAWIPKIYKYEYVNGSNRYVYLSQKKLNDNYEAIGFIDENGLEHDGVWIPMFYGTEITQSDTVKIMSLATGTPSESRDTATQKTYIENFSSKAKFFGGPIINVLADLLIMLGKNSDVQAVFGTGNSSGGNGAQYMKANACINGGAFYGSSTNTALNKAFHSLVLLTQNQWQRDPYTLCYKGEYIVSPYYKYDLTGASYVNTGVFVTPPSSNNWVYPNKSVSVSHWGAIPVGPYSGSTTTGWADGQYTLATQLTDTTVRVVRRFANCNDGRTGGVRCVALSLAASSTYWYIGASPLLLSEEKTRA